MHLPDDRAAVATFLRGSEWPFHRTPRPTTDEAHGIPVMTDDVESHWIALEGRRVGLIRLLDLGDIPDGTRADTLVFGRLRTDPTLPSGRRG